NRGRRSVIRFGCLTVSSIGGNGFFAFIVKRFRVFRARRFSRPGPAVLRARWPTPSTGPATAA
ncbi:hypothetical protein ABLN67_07090, partial [Mycobacterium tuberculosis]